MNRIILMAGIWTLLLFGAVQASASSIYDLANDWSNTSNPNGPWSYNGGSNPLPLELSWDPSNVASFTGIQPAWAYAPQPSDLQAKNGNQVPFWLKSVGNSQFDMPAGKVIVHSYDTGNGAPGTYPANIT